MKTVIITIYVFSNPFYDEWKHVLLKNVPRTKSHQNLDIESFLLITAEAVKVHYPYLFMTVLPSPLRTINMGGSQPEGLPDTYPADIT
jgi:hypothetical protein